MRPSYLSHPASLEHDTGAHPERAARIVAIEEELSARDWLGLRAGRGAAGCPLGPRGRAPGAVHRGHPRALRGRGRADRPRHGGVRRVVGGGAARGGRSGRAGRPAAGRQRSDGGVGAAASGAPRGAGAGDGVLPVQQRGRGRAARAVGARAVAGVGAGLGRAPRERDRGGVRLVAVCAVRVAARMAAVSGDRPGVGRRERGGRRLHAEPAGAVGVGECGVRVAGGDVVAPVALAYAPELVLLSAGYDAHARIRWPRAR